jgi:membrane protease subunit (stomatin/prohibitin family)
VGVTGPAYDEICQAIVDLEQQVESKNGDIQQINAEIYAQQGTQPTPQPVSGPVQYPSAPAPTQSAPPPAPAQAAVTTKFCPNCGKAIPVAVKFCPDCGTAV